jgi:hypothetical protein
MERTAVEWLENEITNRITRRNPHDSIIIQTQGETLIELLEQAKEMEKQQSQDYAAFCINCDRKNYPIVDFESYLKL